MKDMAHTSELDATEWHSNIPSADDCARLCSNEAWCLGYNYRTMAFSNSQLHRNCELYADIFLTTRSAGTDAGRCEVSK